MKKGSFDKLRMFSLSTSLSVNILNGAKDLLRLSRLALRLAGSR
jgi:hypothetical protein